MRNPVLILAAALAALALGLGLWSWQQWARQNAPVTSYVSATVLQTPRELPVFTLVDQSGATFSREKLLGNWHLLFFGYTHCPDVCPNTLGMLHGVSEALKKNKDAAALKVVFISVDPEHDKPKQLAAYVRYFDPDFIAATGSLEELRKLTGSLYLPFSYTPTGNKGDYTVDHSGSLVLLDPRGKAVAYFSPPHHADAMVADLRHLMARVCRNLEIKDAWLREMPPGVNVAAAYMTLTNTGDKPIIVTEISSPDFLRGEFHSMSMDNGSMHMEKLDKITVPSHGHFVLEPDGNHVMLFDPRSRLSAGDTVPLDLSCDSGVISLTLPVRNPNAENTQRHHHE